MSKIVVAVIPLDQEERLRANAPPQSADVTRVKCNDPKKVVETVKAQPQTPAAVIVTNFFPESVQNEIKADVEASCPGVPVVLIPQGLGDEEAMKFLHDLKK